MNAPFQTLAEVDDYLSGDTITCLLCGKRLQRLHKHLYGVHNMGPDEYRTVFGIPYQRSLTSAPSRAKTGAAMTPERIEAFKRLRSHRSPGSRGKSPKGRVPAVINQWRKDAEGGRYFSRKKVVAKCVKCGVEVHTTALSATQPVRCLGCTTPGALKARRHYWLHHKAA
jgi:DNA-directed RNA polymerase subunit RPC12/RpoP